MSELLNLEVLRSALAGRAAAFRCVTQYQPAGGPGDKVFPPTYEGGKYATEERVDPVSGELTPCVLLDSVQSQANRMELALLEIHRQKQIHLPLVVTRFDQEALPKKFTVNSLEAPHRVADALFRDSLLAGVMFRQSEKGRILDTAEVRNATGLFGLCPTALVFGIWDSTGPRGGLGAKFQRALVSEIVGYNAIPGMKTASRIDPAAIEKRAGPVFRTNDGNWTLDPDKAIKAKGKPVLFALSKKKSVPYDPKTDGEIPDQGRPSKINHGNVTPSISDGGFTLSRALQSTVLSLAALRRLRFPLNGTADSDPEVDLTARTVLAALGLTAATLARTDGDLRSRCHLFPETASQWQLLARPGKEHPSFDLDDEQAIALSNEAIEAAQAAGLPWEGVIELTPSEELVELVRRSQELASANGGENG